MIVSPFYRDRSPDRVGELFDPTAPAELVQKINAEFDEYYIYGHRRLERVYEARHRAGKTLELTVKFMAERLQRSTSAVYRWLARLKITKAIERGIDAGRHFTKWVWEYPTRVSPNPSPKLKRSGPAKQAQPSAPAPLVGSVEAAGPPLPQSEIAERIRLVLPREARPFSQLEFEESRRKQLADLAELRHADEANDLDSTESPEQPVTVHPRE